MLIVNNNTTLNELLEMAKQTVPAINKGEIFLVKDLFRGYEWKRVDIGRRNKLGSLFLMYAEGDGKEIIRPAGKTSQNQQQYEML